jgi:hypothetical protein
MSRQIAPVCDETLGCHTIRVERERDRGREGSGLGLGIVGIRAGDHWSFKRSKQIAPVYVETLGCHTMEIWLQG